MILDSFISSTYKTFTGRIQPNLHDFVTNNSHAFNFGFYEHGIFWGWPSSHTTIAFAMAFTSIMIFRKSRTVFIFSVMYAFYIGIGVSLFIHWFSDFFAGAIIGTVIGIVVGGHFRQQFESKNTGLIVS
jgi:membrane-associated phospholipid phosphatase